MNNQTDDINNEKATETNWKTEQTETESASKTDEKLVLKELEQIKDEFGKQIRTPFGTKLLAAILSGLFIGLVIWITMSFVTQSTNPPVTAWILGIIILQVADALSNFTSHIQRISSKILKDNLD